MVTSKRVKCPNCGAMIFTQAQSKFSHCGGMHSVEANLDTQPPEVNAVPSNVGVGTLAKLPTPPDKPEDEEVTPEEIRQVEAIEKEVEVVPTEQELDKNKLTGKTPVQREAENRIVYCSECSASNDKDSSHCRDCGTTFDE